MFVTLCDKRKIFKIIKWMEGVVNLRESNVLTDLIIHLVKKKIYGNQEKIWEMSVNF